MGIGDLVLLLALLVLVRPTFEMSRLPAQRATCLRRTGVERNLERPVLLENKRALTVDEVSYSLYADSSFLSSMRFSRRMASFFGDDHAFVPATENARNSADGSSLYCLTRMLLISGAKTVGKAEKGTETTIQDFLQLESGSAASVLGTVASETETVPSEAELLASAGQEEGFLRVSLLLMAMLASSKID